MLAIKVAAIRRAGVVAARRAVSRSLVPGVAMRGKFWGMGLGFDYACQARTKGAQGLIQPGFYKRMAHSFDRMMFSNVPIHSNAASAASYTSWSNLPEEYRSIREMVR